MSTDTLETNLEAAARALRQVDDFDEPVMQLVRIRISGVDYQCFASVMDEGDEEMPAIQAIEFGDIIPMSMVIRWLLAAQEAHQRGFKAELQ